MEREDLQLLAEIGLLALSRCRISHAETIFTALELARPASVGGYVGLATTHVFAGRPNEALTTLSNGLRNSPIEEHGLLHTIRGFALRCLGMNAASDQALDMAGDVPLARALRRGAIAPAYEA